MKRSHSLLRALLAAALCVCLTVPAVAQTFPDVPSSYWAYNNIERAAADGAVRGYADGTFAPMTPLTLAHFTVILARSFYAAELERASGSSSLWYAPAEQVARAHGLLSNIDVGMNEPLSRYYMAVELYNFLQDHGVEVSAEDIAESAQAIRDLSDFPNASIRGAVLCAYALNLLGGYSDGTFRGDNILTRAQAAAVYCRLKDLDVDMSNDDVPTPSNDDNSIDLPTRPSDDVPEPSNDDNLIDLPDPPRDDVPEPPNDDDLIDVPEPPRDDVPTPPNDDDLIDVPTPPNDDVPTPTEPGTPAEAVLALVNEARAAENLPPLELSDKLVQAAQIRAAELPELFSHTRPSGESCFSVLDEVGVSWMAVGENIAAGQSTPAAVMDSWMNSPGHRANILSGDFGKLGVGMCQSSGGYGVYWVQIFTN